MATKSPMRDGAINYHFCPSSKRHNVYDRRTGDLIGTVTQVSECGFKWSAYDTFRGKVMSLTRALDKIKEHMA